MQNPPFGTTPTKTIDRAGCKRMALKDFVQKPHGRNEAVPGPIRRLYRTQKMRGVVSVSSFFFQFSAIRRKRYLETDFARFDRGRLGRFVSQNKISTEALLPEPGIDTKF